MYEYIPAVLKILKQPKTSGDDNDTPIIEKLKLKKQAKHRTQKINGNITHRKTRSGRKICNLDKLNLYHITAK